MANEIESYVEMRSSEDPPAELYSQVDNNRGTNVTLTTPPIPLKTASQYVAPIGKSQTLRRMHSSHMCASPLAKVEKELPYGASSTHLEPEKEVSLQDLVTMHHKMLPLRTKVTKKRAQNEAHTRDTLVVGGLYNLHFTTRKKMATFTLSTGETFTLPVDAKVNCAVVYNPEGDTTMATTGYTFKDVLDLSRTQPMPLIVCATQRGVSRKIESACMPGEVLALKTVQDNQERVCIGAYSFKTESIKVLEEGCNGFFTTQPSDIQLPLLRVINELSPKLPCEVQLFGAENEPGVSAIAASGSLLSLQVEESVLLVATCPRAPNEVMEVIVTPDTEVKFVEVGGKDLLEMKSETSRLQFKYGLTKKIQVRSLSGTSIGSGGNTTYSNQDISSPQTPSGGATQPAFVYDLPYNDTHAQVTTGRLAGLSGNRKKSIDLVLPSSPLLPPRSHAVISVPEVGPRDAIPYEIQGGGTAADIESLIVSYEELKHDLSECNDALKEHRKEIVAAQRDIEQLQKEIETLKRQSGQREGEHRGTTYQDNINLLSALSNKEILQLLEGLGLSQYKKKFSSERVTGKILIQCNEKTLEKDLGVSSKLHRMHLMEFIQGSECVYSVIAKQ